MIAIRHTHATRARHQSQEPTPQVHQNRRSLKDQELPATFQHLASLPRTASVDEMFTMLNSSIQTRQQHTPQQ